MREQREKDREGEREIEGRKGEERREIDSRDREKEMERRENNWNTNAPNLVLYSLHEL